VAATSLLLVWAVTIMTYFVVGFAFQFGGIAQVSPDPDLRGLYWEWYPLDQSVDVEIARLWGVIALRGWGLAGEAATPGALRLFLIHLALAGSAALIPAGTLLQQGRRGTALLVGMLMGALIYPVAGNWVWGGGWLSHLGSNLGLGHGLVDFGGASLVFLAGSAVALVALLLLKPAGRPQQAAPAGDELIIVTKPAERLTVYEEAALAPVAEQPLPEFKPMPSAYLPLLSLLGAGLALLGWLGLSSGLHIPTAASIAPSQAAVSGALAGLAAALTAGGYAWFTTREFNPWMTSRGLIAGLVIAAAGGIFMPVWVAVVAGLLFGLCLPLLTYLLDERLKLVDASGTLATYGVSAVISLLLVAFFADGRAGQGWNGVGLTEYRGVAGQGVSGLIATSGFLPDWPQQFQAQLLGSGIVLLWALLLSFLLFKTIAAIQETWARSGLELASHPKEVESRGKYEVEV
jgi:Amt family ammonium transporter